MRHMPVWSMLLLVVFGCGKSSNDVDAELVADADVASTVDVDGFDDTLESSDEYIPATRLCPDSLLTESAPNTGGGFPDFRLKKMWLISETPPVARLALYWKNGEAVWDRVEYRCGHAAEDLLPSGIIYYDINMSDNSAVFVGEVVMHISANDALAAIFRPYGANQPGSLLIESRDVFKDGTLEVKRPPERQENIYARYLVNEDTLLLFQFLARGSSPHVSLDRSGTPSDPLSDLVLSERSVYALRRYNVVAEEGEIGNLQYVLSSEYTVIPLDVSVTQISREHARRSGCGCTDDGLPQPPIRSTVPVGDPGPPRRDGYYSCGQVVNVDDHDCTAPTLSSIEFTYLLPWEDANASVMFLSTGLLGELGLGDTAESLTGYANNFDALYAGGLPDSYMLHYGIDVGEFLDDELTVGLHYSYSTSLEPSRTCAYFVGTFFMGASATIDWIDRVEGTPGRISGSIAWDDSALPAKVALPACERTWEFALPVWDDGRD